MQFKLMFDNFRMLQGYIGTPHAFKAVAFKGASDFIHTFTGQAAIAIGTTYAMYKALQVLSDAYNLSYDSAMKNTSENLDNFNSTQSEIEKLKLQAEEYKDTLSSLSEKYDVDLSGIDSIDEKISTLQNSGKIELIDQIEIDKISEANDKLESQLSIKERLSQSQQKDAAYDAKDALKRGKQSVAQQVAQKVPGGKKTYQGMVDNVNAPTAVKEDIDDIKEYERLVSDLEKSMSGLDPNSEKWKQAEKDIASYNSAIEELTVDLDNKEVDLGKLLAATSVNGEGLEALKGFEDEFKEVKSAYDAINNIDLSPAEKQLSQINSFFDGSTGSNYIKDRLQEIADKGNITEKSLEKMGLSLDSFGLEGKEGLSALNKYFDDLKKNVEEVKNTIEDASLESVTSAFESENKDSQWSKMADFGKQAQELAKSKKWGTDDLQSMVQFMVPNLDVEKEMKKNPEKYTYAADVYEAKWKEANKRIKRYFDSENPLQSAVNFQDDMLKKGLFKEDESGLTGTFGNTAEAAKKMNLSIEATEMLLHNLESYGFEFDKVMFSGDALNRYKTSLDGMKEIYDSMIDGAEKESLGKLLFGDDGFNAQYQTFEDDLSKLSKEQVVEIEFQYDLSQIKADIANLQKEAKEGGGSESWAKLNVANSKYREKMEDKTGVNEDSTDESNQGYIDTYKQIAELQDSMIGKKSEEKEAIQEQIDSVYDLQNAFQDSLAAGEVKNWDEFLNTDQYKRLIDNMAQIASNMSNEMKTSLGQPIHLNIDGTPTLEKVKSEMEDLEKGSTIEFRSPDLDGIERKVTAIKNEDGSITFNAEINGEPTEVELNKDGTIKYSADMSKAKSAKSPEKKGIVEYAAKFLKAVAPTLKGTINYTAKIAKKVMSTAGNIMHSSGAPRAGGAGQLSGTAHAGGTVKKGRALETGTIEDDSLLQPQWRTKKSETALVGEEGQELVATRDNEFYTVGDNGAEFAKIPKGSIVFNANQTEELLSKGHINSRGQAYLDGTAYASGNGGRKLSSSSTKKKKPTKSKSSSNSKSTNKAKKSSDKVSKSLEKIINSLEKLFDWIEVRVERLEDRIDLNLAKADNATNYQSKNTYVSSAQSDTASLIGVQQKAATKYQKQADKIAKKVKLPSSLKKKVDNGTIDIQSLSENNKKRVEAYKEFVDKANAAKQAVEDLKQQQKELAQQKLDNIVEQYESIVNLAESAQKTSKSIVEYYTSAGKVVNSNEAKSQIKSQMSQQNNITANLQAQISAYTAELANAAKVFGTNSNEYREASEKLQDINASLYESKTAYNELNKQLYELDLSRIQYVIDNLETLGDKIKNIISLAEKRGSTITEDDYLKQVSNNNSVIEQYYKDHQTRIDEIAKNGWEVGSEQYQEVYEKIMKDEDAIYSLLEANEDLKESIVKLRWKPFDELQDKLENAIDDLDFVRDLLNEDGFFDDNGKTTSQGYAGIALIGESMAISKKQVADYRKALEKLEEEYQNGNITLESYNERSRDYIDDIKDSIKSIEDYKDALIDLYETQIKTENEALQKSIQLRKDALDKKKEYYDYDKKLKSQNKDINTLKAQISALSGVSNQAGQAELARLKAQLAEAEDERDETIRDHEYEIKISGYDKLSEDADQALEDTLHALETNSQKQQEVVNMMLESIKENYSSAYGEIQNIISDTGLVAGKEAQSALDSLKTVLDAVNMVNSAQSNQLDVSSSSQANGINTGKITTSTDSTNKIESAIGGDTAANIKAQTDAENARKAEEERKRKEEEARLQQFFAVQDALQALQAISNPFQGTSETVTIGGGSSSNKDKLKKVKSIINGNKERGKVSTKEYNSHADLWKYIYKKSPDKIHITEANQLAIGKALGVKGLPKKASDLTKSNKNAILKALKDVGYKKGTKSIPKDGNFWTHENEIIIRKSDGAILRNLSSGDAVVPANLSSNLMKWGNINPNILNLGSMGANVPEIKRPNYEVNVNYGSLFTIYGAVDKYVVDDLGKLGKDLIKNKDFMLGINRGVSSEMKRAVGKNSYK